MPSSRGSPRRSAGTGNRSSAARASRRDTLRFLALSLDAEGRPIPVVNTDPATGLFLGTFTSSAELDQFVRPYPVALFAEGLGPLVANDAYASPAIWERFRKDTYHGPRVVWGREVNLLLLALAIRVGEGADPDGRFAGALRKTLAAVHASGLEHTELWSYRIEGGRLVPTRYGDRLRHPALERDRPRRPVRAGEAERLDPPHCGAEVLSTARSVSSEPSLSPG